MKKSILSSFIIIVAGVFLSSIVLTNCQSDRVIIEPSSENIAAAQEIISNMISRNVAYFTPNTFLYREMGSKIIWHNKLIFSLPSRAYSTEISFNDIRLELDATDQYFGEQDITIEYYKDGVSIEYASFMDDCYGGYWSIIDDGIWSEAYPPKRK